ncbi:YciI family protein [Actinomadura sp. 9N215]|uniref:YciI family protein n=1 Tax=Actinomadura sp. 9N215 TaxID=3375150 RepID=UPI003796151E
MSYFVYKLVPHRPDFPADMTDAEASTMGEHVAYWQALADKGTAVVFGPVADPAGYWGLAIVETDDEEQVRAVRAADPVIRDDIGRVSIYPMADAIIGSSKTGHTL